MNNVAKPNIMVVDDTPANLKLLSNMLQERGYEVRPLQSGKMVLNAARTHPPDLILLDINMPEINGYEVCEQLKADAALCGIPVIFISALTETEDKIEAFRRGGVDYVTKPFQFEEVLARVNTHLLLKDARCRLEDLSRKLARYLSPQVYLSIFEGKQDAHIGSNRKKLTIFMSDIVGFSRQTDCMEAEDLTTLLNSYLNRMARIVLAHGGTIDKYMGDAILVFFGDPESKGVVEDAAACVAMALEMRAAVDELRAEWQKKGICTNFEIRMGITTGYCTVGNFGSEERMDYTIIGGQVNLANRLQNAAVPGEILIGPETFALVGDRFQCIRKEAVHVKGLEEPVQPHQVVGARSACVDATRIEDSRNGFTLALDPSAVDPEERKTVVEILRAAISSLR
ncbi:MAG TPA: response regulator [Candidatus Hydrogenedentes bacterium]|nr:response regulator [Candidatus Hydrogenedentota bacterium]